ncbi:UNVERIFIED_CONTAM: hypothetical protein FKN15_033256 [Acipenser sinensis]
MDQWAKVRKKKSILQMIRMPQSGGTETEQTEKLLLPSVAQDGNPPQSPSLSRPKSPWGRYDPYDSAEDQEKEYVGFATLPNQVHRKSVKKGFDFTLMVAGESGLGKSTLVNSLFLTDLYKDRKLLNAEERITQTVEITKHSVDIEEKGVKLRLTVVDTPGFGDAVNNTECWKSVADYIDQQFEQYFRDESGLNRKNIQDNRVHCCLYFISPFGHGLRPLDVEFMKALHEKVNIVPILAKADTLTPAEVKKKKMKDQEKEYVGFATLPNQVHRKSVKKGFDFTLMVAGESGLGKSTLVNSLFLTDLYKDRKLLNAEERITQTVEITKHSVDIEEKGVKLRLTVVDTPGFGDAVNNTECWKSVADYIDQQFEQYFRDESGLNRKNIQDNRVHCCLYFISPFGHGLRPLDVEFMKALHEKVNIVPILAKADTLTPAEVKKKKMKIREEIDQYCIKVYQFPDCDSDEDEDFKQQDHELKESIPFAVIGSNTVVEAKGKRVRGRLYPWGIVEVENTAHCDFVKLRNMLVRTHMQDLKDVTRETHYENYRAHCIQSMTRMVVKERNRNKLTRESGTDFPIPVVPAGSDSETEKLIREKDEEVRESAGS